MLTVGKQWILKNLNPDLKVNLYGQEINDTTYAICKSDFLISGEDPENIKGQINLHCLKINLKVKNLII